jgi:NAD(P)-dependent dehydrogenase (short-subunit alcohol dehydrogenase family)
MRSPSFKIQHGRKIQKTSGGIAMATESSTKKPDASKVIDRPEPPFPGRKLKKPGLEKDLDPKPEFAGDAYKPAGKLQGRKALVTGGDSGIGRSVAVLFAKEGADVAINYLPEEQVDADEVKRYVEAAGRRCVQLPGDLTDSNFCRQLVESAVKELGGIDIVVSNAAYENRRQSIEEISEQDWEKTFRTNIDALFFITRAVIPHLKPGSSIIVTSSETGLFGNRQLLDYSATKGAINAFVKSLAQNLVPKGIGVNAVAPGPVWTPLNPADEGESSDQLSKFGSKTPLGRPAQPDEIAPAYVFFASNADSSYISGHILPLIGGDVTSG